MTSSDAESADVSPRSSCDELDLIDRFDYTMALLKRGISLGLWNGAKAFAVNGGVSFLFSLATRPRYVLSHLVKCAKEAFGSESMGCGAFIAALTGGYEIAYHFFKSMRAWLQSGVVDDELERALERAARRAGRTPGVDRVAVVLAAALASSALLFETPARRVTIALYVFARSFDDYLRARIKRGYFKAPKYSRVWLFALMNSAVMYFAMVDPVHLNQGYYRWILYMGNLRNSQLHNFYRIKHYQFTECNPTFHDGPCGTANVRVLLEVMVRAARMYFPVHFVPLALLRHRALLDQPLKQLRQVGENLFWSSLFLGCYVYFMRRSQCWMRNYNAHVLGMPDADTATNALIGGFLAGLSLFFERPKRHAELLLYVAPRAIEGVARMLGSWYPALGALSSPATTVTMMLAVAMAMYNYELHPSRMVHINYRVINNLFGHHTGDKPIRPVVFSHTMSESDLLAAAARSRSSEGESKEDGE